jgi:hypothetical protein
MVSLTLIDLFVEKYVKTAPTIAISALDYSACGQCGGMGGWEKNLVYFYKNLTIGSSRTFASSTIWLIRREAPPDPKRNATHLC